MALSAPSQDAPPNCLLSYVEAHVFMFHTNYKRLRYLAVKRFFNYKKMQTRNCADTDVTSHTAYEFRR